MPRRLVQRKEAPQMSKGALLETCAKRRHDIIEVFLKLSPPETVVLPGGSWVTSLGVFHGNLGCMYLKCLAAPGVCWIRVKNLQQRRPGETIDESKVTDRPRRKGDR